MYRADIGTLRTLYQFAAYISPQAYGSVGGQDHILCAKWIKLDRMFASVKRCRSILILQLAAWPLQSDSKSFMLAHTEFTDSIARSNGAYRPPYPSWVLQVRPLQPVFYGVGISMACIFQGTGYIVFAKSIGL